MTPELQKRLVGAITEWAAAHRAWDDAHLAAMTRTEVARQIERLQATERELLAIADVITKEEAILGKPH